MVSMSSVNVVFVVVDNVDTDVLLRVSLNYPEFSRAVNASPNIRYNYFKITNTIAGILAVGELNCG